MIRRSEELVEMGALMLKWRRLGETLMGNREWVITAGLMIWTWKKVGL